MNTDLSTDIKTTGLLNVTAATTPGSDSASFDCADGRFTLLTGLVGSGVGAAAVVTVQDSADNVTFAAVPGVGTLDVSLVDLSAFTILVDHRKVRRYVRVNVLKEAGTNTRVHITATSFGGISGGTNGADLVIA